MGLNLTKMDKGGRLNLSKKSQDEAGKKLSKLKVGVAWDFEEGLDADLDAVVLLLDENNKCVGQAMGENLPKEGAIYYNNRFFREDIVQLSEDNRDGKGDGDDETAVINLDKIPADVKKILTVVTICNEEGKPKTVFGQIDVAKVNLYDEESGEQLSNFDLSENASTNTSVIMSEIYRNDSGDWMVKTVGKPMGEAQNGLYDVLGKYN